MMLNHLQTSLLLVTLSLAWSSVYGQQGTMNEVIYASTYGNGQDFGYLEYLPSGYTSGSEKYAVLISLHGKGWMADGQTIQFSKIRRGNHVAKLYYYDKKDFPFIVISPQQPKSVKGRYSGTNSWDTRIINEVLERVRNLRRVDDTRIYVTGTSMGGGGVWKFIKDYGDKVAAAAPMAPSGNERGSACSDKIKNVAVWSFHNSGDNLTSPRNTVDMVDAINACSPPIKARKTIFKNGTHNVWNRVYKYTSDEQRYALSKRYLGSTPYGPNSGQPQIFDWFLTHSRDESFSPPSNQRPNAIAGSDKSITLPTSEVTLSGSNSSDSDGSIASYRWSKVSGPSSSTIVSSNSSNTAVRDLVEGTYTFRLTVNDNDGASATDDVRVIVNSAEPAPAPVEGNGIQYAYYEGNWDVLPDFSRLTPVETGQLDNFSLSPKLQDGYYAFKFDGFIDIETGGTYTFYTASDDGSKLYIDGKEVVNNDGRHGETEKSGQVSLSAGQHAIRVTYFDKWGNSDVLKVSYQGPGITKQRIPDNILFVSDTDTGGNAESTELSYAYYEGNWDELPDFSTLTPEKTGTLSNFSLSPRLQSDYFAFKFDGFIDIETSGTYTFYTSSDDGSKLYIDGREIVNNDGTHGREEKSGQVTLAAGRHAIEVTYFEKWGGETLEVRYKGPGTSKQVIPNEILSDNKGTGRNTESTELSYAYYEGNWDVLPDFSTLTPEKTGTLSNFSLSPRLQDSYYAFKFDGFIDIETGGTYTFYTASDDGSKLYIDGKEVVNNDGRHGETEKSGQVSLSAGQHAIRVTYFDKYGNNDVLRISFKGPNFGKQEIPDGVLGSAGARFAVKQNDGNEATLPGEEFEFNLAQMVAYPNPADSYLRLDHANGAQYHIFNYAGQSVLSGRVNDKEDINVSGLPDGIYFLKVQLLNNLISKKILIRH